jgi:hypothetical protein
VSTEIAGKTPQPMFGLRIAGLVDCSAQRSMSEREWQIRPTLDPGPCEAWLLPWFDHARDALRGNHSTDEA